MYGSNTGHHIFLEIGKRIQMILLTQTLLCRRHINGDRSVLKNALCSGRNKKLTGEAITLLVTPPPAIPWTSNRLEFEVDCGFYWIVKVTVWKAPGLP